MEIIYKEGLPDRAELFSLYGELRWNEFLKLNAYALHQAMQNSYYVVGAFSGEHLLGIGRVNSDGVTNAYLCGLGVQPEYRNQGIGQKNNRITARSLPGGQHLHVQFFCKEDLLPFYEAQGFEHFAIGVQVAT